MSVPYIKDDKPYPVPTDYIEPTDVTSKLLAIKTIGTFKFEDKLLKREKYLQYFGFIWFVFARATLW